MSFSPVARVSTPTVALLRRYLHAYRGISPSLIWRDASGIIDANFPGYARSHLQNTNQLGLEYRQNDNRNNFEIQSYLLCFDDDMLTKYLSFWSMLYYAPNLRITHDAVDTPLIIFAELAREILAAPIKEIHFPSFCTSHCAGGSTDIMQSILRDHALYLDLNGDTFSVSAANIAALTALVDFIDLTFPIPPNHLDRRAFFDRFSCEKFKLFYSHFGETFTKGCSHMQHNKILYGAPGTGKSFKLQEDALCHFSPSNIERINFYNGYTYGQFVGTYKPMPVYRELDISAITPPPTPLPTIPPFNYKEEGAFKRTPTSEPYVVYEYIPGFFLKMIIRALLDRGNIYCLIIEEINRSKVDAVFGDMFQLLDRNGIGKSEYRVKCSDEMLSYINSTGLDVPVLTDITDNGLYIPENLYLWATMNSADQGVFPMDTAFKRRWNFEYIGLNENEVEMNIYEVVTNDATVTDKTWNKFRRTMNKVLSEKYNVSEDKLLAPFFLKKSDFDAANILEPGIFVNKVIMYLKEDVLRHRNADEIFLDKQFSDIVYKYNNGNPIFAASFITELKTP